MNLLDSPSLLSSFGVIGIFVVLAINPLAGIVGVPPRTFVPAPVGGGLVWTVGVTLAGYALGTRIPGIDTYLLPVLAAVVVLSLVPVAVEVLRSRRGGAPR